MRTIVVPVNFTPASDNAARYAADLAAAIGASLRLFHVLLPPFVASEYPMPDGAFEALRDSAAAQLETLAAVLAKQTAGRVPIGTDLEIGGVEYKVQKFCDEVQPFVVVMGAAGMPLERFLAGSPTLQALRRLPYPMLVIPDAVRFERPERIALACDYEDIHSGMIGAADFLQELKELFGAKFDVVNVRTPTEDDHGQLADTRGAWRARLKEIYPELHFVHTESVTGGIGDYLKSHPADWLVVFPKKHAFYELHSSKAKKIVLHSPIPVMSIHE